MALLDQFVGGTYQAISPTFAADQAVNVMLETRRTSGSSKEKWLIGTPGLKLFTTAVGAGCRGFFSQDGVTLVVIGSGLYLVNISSGVTSLTGSINDNGLPVSFASNGKGGDQIAIVGGGELRVLTTSTLNLSGVVPLPFANPVQVVFLDGYFIINQEQSPVCWFSGLEDGLTWDALDFFTRSGTSDDIVGLGMSRNRIWVFGSRTTTLFYDSGDADVPFVPYPETATQIGCVTPWAIALRNDIFTWLAQDTTGTTRVVKASGDPSPNPVSTPPIELWLAKCPNLVTARALTYGQTGHSFYALTCSTSPDDVQTYVHDEVEDLWHARAGWDEENGVFTLWRARWSVQVDNIVLVGDYENAKIYTLDQDTFDDDGATLKRTRRIPYVSDETSNWLFVDQVELVAQVGVGTETGQGAAPVAELLISRDAAQTWTSAGTRALGAIGRYLHRTIWHRVGRVRPDRLVLEVSMTDPVKCAWLGLTLRSHAGSGQL